jgi:hypothetical protein
MLRGRGKTDGLARIFTYDTIRNRRLQILSGDDNRKGNNESLEALKDLLAGSIPCSANLLHGRNRGTNLFVNRSVSVSPSLFSNLFF